MKEVVIVGAGIFGCTCARILAEAGFNVKLREQRYSLGGNAAAYFEAGIEVHKYGCHIFHTDNDDVWKFMNRFTQFNQYQHHCVAKCQNTKFFLPFNMMLVEQFFGVTFKDPADAQNFMAGMVKRGIAERNIDPSNPKNLEEQAITMIGVDLYEAFVKNYTKKQWHCDPKELDASIIKRIPIRYNYNISYFNDRYQGIPLDGYNDMFNNMVDHSNIKIVGGIPYTAKELIKDISRNVTVIYTGAPDQLLGYKFGTLPWRSLYFKTECVPVRDFQGNSCVNYVDADVDFTRIHEFKHYCPERRDAMQADYTIIQYEFPDDWTDGKERYYPVNNECSTKLYEKYASYIKDLYNGKLVLGGRLGMFKYYDMDDAVEVAMKLADKLTKEL